MPKRDLLLLIGIGVLLLTLSFLLILVQQRQDIRPRAEFGNAQLRLTPNTITLPPSQSFQLEFWIDTGLIPLSALDVSFVYNPQILQITSILPETTTLFTDTLKNTVTAGSARLVLLARKSTTQLPRGNLRVATISLTALNEGTSNVEIRPKELVGFNGIEQDVRLAVGSKLDAQIIVVRGAPTTPPTLPPGITPSPTTTLPPGITPSPTSITITLPPGVTIPSYPTLPVGITPTLPPGVPAITFKTIFVGMGQSRPDVTVRLTIVEELTLEPLSNVLRPLVTSNTARIYQPIQSPLPLFNVIPSVGKTILLKGPKHLQKKVESRIELVAGLNPAFDWTRPDLQLEPGDLPDPNRNLEQDGVVNAVDVGLLISRIGSRDPQDLQIADLNYDGFINANDLSLLIETLAIRFDDETF